MMRGSSVGRADGCYPSCRWFEPSPRSHFRLPSKVAQLVEQIKASVQTRPLGGPKTLSPQGT